jgi:anaerobic magnesium-protoporphyrin IX monomethyl ester cyclase
MPSDCLEMGFDAVVVGEGELVISDVIHRKPRGIIRGKAVKNLDELPFPDRNDFNKTAYGGFGFLKLSRPSTSIMTSRGCPFNCRFCGRIIKGALRRRSVESVIKELRQLQRQGFKNIFIADDNFTTNRKWTLDFCRVLKKDRMKFNLFYQARVSNFDKQSAKALRAVGTQYISFGVESIHPDVLRFYNKTKKPSMWRELVKKALGHCNDAGIYSQASLIVGAPMETEEMFWESHDFVIDNDADTINVNPLTYIVGSDIWRDAVRKGIVADDEYIVSVRDRELCPIPPRRIDAICNESFRRVLRRVGIPIISKTLKHIDRLRVELMFSGLKKFVLWRLLSSSWRKHFDVLREYGYGKRKEGS